MTRRRSLLLLDPPAMPELPPRPTKKHAANALKFLDALLSEFPFVDAASHSVALSALITPVVRGAISVTPMHATTAPVPGSGKSYIIDLASAINSGERAPVLTAGRNEEETEKRLVAALLSGQTIISIDNVNGQLGGDALCQIIERPVVAVRPLGQSTFTKVESRASCFATGNNIQLVGDMTRRVLLCSLDPDVERPELRVFHSNPFDAVLADRGKYVAAALIVVRAYVVAGCPGVLPPLASFEDWSRMVRSALVWLGRPDPCDTMNKARAEDPITSSLTNLFTSWHVAAGSAPQTVGAIKDIASLNDSFGRLLHGNLREALSTSQTTAGAVSTRRSWAIFSSDMKDVSSPGSSLSPRKTATQNRKSGRFRSHDLRGYAGFCGVLSATWEKLSVCKKGEAVETKPAKPRKPRK
jgi:putative DNA primase/helicase